MGMSPNCRIFCCLSYILLQDSTSLFFKIAISKSGFAFIEKKIKETLSTCNRRAEQILTGSVTEYIFTEICLYSGLQNSSARVSVVSAM